jgi:hypothetical protein
MGRSKEQWNKCDNNRVSGMNGFTGGTTDSGGHFADDGGAGFGAAFYEFVEIAAVSRPYFQILRRDAAGWGE